MHQTDDGGAKNGRKPAPSVACALPALHFPSATSQLPFAYSAFSKQRNGALRSGNRTVPVGS